MGAAAFTENCLTSRQLGVEGNRKAAAFSQPLVVIGIANSRGWRR
jgi:hypothetical protein